MADKRTRRRFPPAFKVQAVKRVLDGRNLSEVATELGLSTGQLSTWRLEHLAAGSAEALAQRKAEEAELQRLKRENKRLEEENQILRKAAAFFAKGIA
jgi:transposase